VRVGNSWCGALRRSATAAIVCGAVLGLFPAWAAAQPQMQTVYLDTLVNTAGFFFVEDYLNESENGLDLSSVAVFTGAQNGSVSINPSYGMVIYSPDEDYEGFDGFTFTVKDELGVESDPVFVLIYVEPEESVTNHAPLIVGFYSRDNGGGDYTFTGYVLDDQSPADREVVFGEDLDGETAILGYDGQFSLSLSAQNSTGIASAKYLDPWNVWSPTEYAVWGAY
jgi:hypothetical protein